MIRTYGNKPFQTAVVHGGPGAPGSVACVARELSKICGTVEPIQSQYSVQELIGELREQIGSVAEYPLTLVGHSWGAWLAILFAAERPEFVRQIVLVGCPPLEERFVPRIMERRLARFTPGETALFQSLLSGINEGVQDKQNVAMKQLERLVEKSDHVDAFDIEADKTDLFPVDGKMYATVWPEAAEMRRSGKLMKRLRKIACPVFVIHGDSDPHPVEGVVEPLHECRIDFSCHILKNCGHSPFKERQACREFYDLLKYAIMSMMTQAGYSE